jgi:hypothetical protein
MDGGVAKLGYQKAKERGLTLSEDNVSNFGLRLSFCVDIDFV